MTWIAKVRELACHNTNVLMLSSRKILKGGEHIFEESRSQKDEINCIDLNIVDSIR